MLPQRCSAAALAAALLAVVALSAAPAWAQADCAKSIPNCATCRYQLWRGTVTKAICITCNPGYLVKASGRACWCAPGFYLATDGSCQPCGTNNWCPGAKSTASSADKHACGAHKLTTTRYAQSDRECLAAPGYNWAVGDLSTPCDIGYYNPGFNNRKCTLCPGSLTTNATGSVNLQDCRAGAGYYYLSGKAVACAEGFYKMAIGNFDCAECPTGFSTAPGVVGQTDPSSCNVVRPGFSAPKIIVAGVTEATACPPNTYRAGFQAYANNAVPCSLCPTGLQTYPNTTGASSVDQCLAPPGYGFDAVSGTASPCPIGTFNPGWNKEACTPCGAGGLLTDAPGATSADACYTPAGWGNTRAVDGTLTAAICPLNTYGASTNTYGLVDVACTKCLDHSFTKLTGSTKASDCLTTPGYGYYSGAVLICEYGTYSTGFSQAPCTACGEGYNTTSDPTTLPNALATRGASTGDSCAVDFGWSLVDATNKAKGIKPCTQGWYKDQLGGSPCTKCPAGTTSTIPLAATALTDCNACRPGFGSAAAINLAQPSCAICSSGTFSPGNVYGGEACKTCPQLEQFTGKMVSRRGAATSAECFGEFPNDAGKMDNLQGYDYIKFPTTSLTAITTGADTEADCQAKCAANSACQYFEFRSYKASGDRCRVKLAAAPIAKVDITDATGNWVLFQIAPRFYVAYAAADAAEPLGTGDTIADGLTFADAKAACDAQDACIGFAHSAASTAAGSTGGTSTTTGGGSTNNGNGGGNGNGQGNGNGNGKGQGDTNGNGSNSGGGSTGGTSTTSGAASAAVDIPGTWRTFSGALYDNTVGKVRAVGETINSWVAEPTAN